MKSNYFRNIAGTAILAFSLILGISSITAAQYQDRSQNDRYRRQQAEQLRRDQQDRARRDQQDQWGRDQNSRSRGRGADGYPNWGGNYELRQTALNAGYNEGAKQGRNDRNRNRGYGSDFRNNSSYRNATKDYNSRFGDRELYRRYFQMAFENGYADGLRGA
jgi:type II secretory pathway pseudopilin PulG